MKDAYKPVWFILIIAVGVAAVVGVSTWMKPAERIPWRTDFAAARAEAARDGKPVFLYLTATWCGPCQQLKHTVWADAQVDAALKAYVPVKVDVDEHRDLAGQYLVTPANTEGGIPAFRVLDGQGQIRRESVGGMTPEQFLGWLNGG